MSQNYLIDEDFTLDVIEDPEACSSFEFKTKEINPPTIIKSENVNNEEKFKNSKESQEPSTKTIDEKNKKKKTYECKCGYVAHLDTSYRKHIQYHLNKNEKLLKCQHCTYATFNKGSLTLHKARYCLNNKSFKCPDCNFTTLKWRRLNSHKRAIHEQGNKKVRTKPKNVKHYKCRLCLFISTEKEDVDKHKCEDFDKSKINI